MRLRAALVVIALGALACSCSALLGFERGSPRDDVSDGATDGDRDVRAGEGGADAPADAAEADADAGAIIVVFEDHFDDGVALPRSWDTVTGTPTVEDAGDAPSPPRLFHSHSSAAAPAEAWLGKTVATTGAQAIGCRFVAKLHQGSSTNDVVVAVLRGKSLYVQFLLSPLEWKYYGQAPGDFSEKVGRSLLDTPIDVEIGITAAGKVTVKVDSIVRESTIPPADMSKLTIEIGLHPPLTFDADVVIDDVVCTIRR